MSAISFAVWGNCWLHGGSSLQDGGCGSESWYGSRPVVLKLFRETESEQGSITVFESFCTDLTWKRGTHVNPSFSRDGGRLYFNLPTDQGARTAYMDIADPLN